MSIKRLLALAISLTAAIFAISPGAPYVGINTELLLTGGASHAVLAAAQAPAPLTTQAQPQDAIDDPNLTVISPRNVNYVTDEVFVGSLERSAGFDARLNYPKTMSVLVPRDGMFVTMFIGSSEWVEEGEPIAVFSVVSNELEIDEAALALELAESAHRREIETLENARDEAIARLNVMMASYDNVGSAGSAVGDGSDEGDVEGDEGVDITEDAEEAEDAEYVEDTENDINAEDAEDADGTEGDIGNDSVEGVDSADVESPTQNTADSWEQDISVALLRAEAAVIIANANLEFTIYNGGRNLDFMRARLEDMRERSEDFTIYAPISGFVYDLVYFAVGRSVPVGSLICRISNPEVFQLIISAPNLAQLRLGAPVSIETSRRDAPSFDGIVIGNTTLLGRNEAESKAVIAFKDPQAFLDFGDGSILRLAGLRYRVLIQQADIQNVLLAPRRAINTESSYRYVNILEDGLSKKRYVLVGLTNIEYAQILDGLQAGDVLIMN
ncbi:MAG: hypothetical protein FWH01_09800 [Oscillospiraceae bacterium]|nr:hypothetical protein [Oscillospiraceae bacterium]